MCVAVLVRALVSCPMGRDPARPPHSDPRSRSSRGPRAWWAGLRGEVGSREERESRCEEVECEGVMRVSTTTTWFIGCGEGGGEFSHGCVCVVHFGHVSGIYILVDFGKFVCVWYILVNFVWSCVWSILVGFGLVWLNFGRFLLDFVWSCVWYILVGLVMFVCM